MSENSGEDEGIKEVDIQDEENGQESSCDQEMSENIIEVETIEEDDAIEEDDTQATQQEENGQESSCDQEMSENIREEETIEEDDAIEEDDTQATQQEENGQKSSSDQTSATKENQDAFEVPEDVLQTNKMSENSGEEEVIEPDDTQEEEKGQKSSSDQVSPTKETQKAFKVSEDLGDSDGTDDEGKQMEEVQTETKLPKSAYMQRGNQGGHVLVAGDFRYRFRFRRKARTANKTIFWGCWRKTCRAPLQTNIFDLDDEDAEIIVVEEGVHNHGPDDATKPVRAFKPVVNDTLDDDDDDDQCAKNNMEMELELPLELRERERMRQREMQMLKKKNNELTNITRRLEEKVRSLEKLIGTGDHLISGRKVDPKKAKVEPKRVKACHGKIIVHGLKPELTDDEIENFFEKFGTIVEVERPFDKTKNQPKGFCLITFEQESVVAKLLKTPKQSIGGLMVDIKKATPKVEVIKAPPRPDAMGMVRGGMRGGMRSGRGGVIRGRGRGWGQDRYDYGQGGYGGYGGGYDDYDYGGHGSHEGYGGYGYGDDYYEHGSGGYGDYYGNEGYDGKRQHERPREREQARHHPY